MPQVIVKPEDVKKFADQLSQFNRDLQDRMSRMNGQLKTLGDTWRDQEYHKFEGDFTNTVQMLHRFTDAADKYAQFLTRKAIKAEEFVNQQ